jgi:hypothetical protein
MSFPVNPGARGRPGQTARSERHAARRARPWAVRAALGAALGVGTLAVLASPAFAQGTPTSLSSVIDNLRNWLVGLLATVATLFLTVGGLRYLTAGGDPGQVEKAKVALKSALVGYALAALAPLLVSILAQLF